MAFVVVIPWSAHGERLSHLWLTRKNFTSRDGHARNKEIMYCQTSQSSMLFTTPCRCENSIVVGESLTAGMYQPPQHLMFTLEMIKLLSQNQGRGNCAFHFYSEHFRFSVILLTLACPLQSTGAKSTATFYGIAV